MLKSFEIELVLIFVLDDPSLCVSLELGVLLVIIFLSLARIL